MAARIKKNEEGMVLRKRTLKTAYTRKHQDKTNVRTERFEPMSVLCAETKDRKTSRQWLFYLERKFERTEVPQLLRTVAREGGRKSNRGRPHTLVWTEYWSNELERRADALALGADEGRDKLR